MRYDGRNDLRKAALKRPRDAEELLQEPTLDPKGSDAHRRHLCGAYYLAGYSVECILKVYIILLLDFRSRKSRGSTRIENWSAAVDHLGKLPDKSDLRGANSHNLGRLLRAAQLDAQIDRDEKAKQRWGRCAKWDFAVRYQQEDLPNHLRNRTEVEEFVSACKAIHAWVEQQLISS
jgi:hypothetical protein